MNKAILKSKTFWLNLAVAVVPLFPAIKDLITPENIEVVFGFIGVVGIILRFKTSEAVSITGK